MTSCATEEATIIRVAMSTIPELDIIDAKRRMLQVAEKAKRLEDAGDGWAANDAWERYLTIKNAIAAQERVEQIAIRTAAG
jgi:hypothetical protein